MHGLRLVFLQQNQHLQWRSIVSKSLNNQQKTIHQWVGVLGDCWAVQIFHTYIHRTYFHLQTDHNALTGLLKEERPHGHLARWVLLLQDYNYNQLPAQSAVYMVADAVSCPGPVPDGHLISSFICQVLTCFLACCSQNLFAGPYSHYSLQIQP